MSVHSRWKAAIDINAVVIRRPRKLNAAFIYAVTFSWQTHTLQLRKKAKHSVKFLDISATQFLREINFDPYEAPKTVILTNLAELNWIFRTVFIFWMWNSPKIKIQSLKKCYIFGLQKSAKIGFT